MSMNEPMDWQASMEATELAATAAARRTERVIFGVAQIIEDQRQHLSLINEIKKELQQVGVSETLCMRVGPCEFHGSFVEPFWI